MVLQSGSWQQLYRVTACEVGNKVNKAVKELMFRVFCLYFSVLSAQFLINWMLGKERKELAIFSQDQQLCSKANLICSGTIIWKEMDDGMKSGLLS